MTFEVRPLPEDPSSEVVASFLDVDQTWALSAPGDYETFAVEAFNREGGNYQRLVALMFPARLNKTDEHVTLHLLIHPDDAAGLADTIKHTVAWLASLAALEAP